MKRTKKKICGFFGLVLVVATTVFAAYLPGPEASAIDGVTDEIVVRVVEPGADINITSPVSGTVFLTPEQSFTVSYANVDEALVEVGYVDKDGVRYSHSWTETGLNYDPVDKTYPLNLTEAEFGYGEYTITVKGSGLDGEPDVDVVKFSYLPFDASLSEDEETGDYTVDLNYIPDDGTEESEGKVSSIIINILDKNGQPVGPSPITVKAPGDKAEFNLDEYGLDSGTYTVVATAYDRDGNVLYKPIEVGKIEYKAIPAPDTGGLFQNLNISKADYLITGLIIFALIGVGGLVFISKRSKSTTRRRRR